MGRRGYAVSVFPKRFSTLRNRLDTVGDLDQLAGGDSRVGELAWLDEFHGLPRAGRIAQLRPGVVGITSDKGRCPLKHGISRGQYRAYRLRGLSGQRGAVCRSPVPLLTSERVADSKALAA